MTITNFVLRSLLINIFLLPFPFYHIIDSRREPVGKIIWLFIVIFFPVVGIILYFIFGSVRFKFKIKRYKKSIYSIKNLSSENFLFDNNINNPAILSIYKKTVKCHNLLNSLNQFPAYSRNQIDLLICGNEAYSEMLKAIENAKHIILFQSYIFQDDVIGKKFSDALIKKAKENVDVYVIYDPIGSIKTKKSFWKNLKKNGVRVKSFGSINFVKRKFRINFRNHRKNLVIDNKIVFSGGLNIHKENVKEYTSSPIQDYHFKITGPVVNSFETIFAQDWFFITREKIILNKKNITESSGDTIIRVIDSNPANNYRVFMFTLLGAINSAEKSIKVITPYFYPEPEILSALKCSALSGIDVKIILPQKNDFFILDSATKSLYQELLECNVEIYERKNQFIHTKLFVIDDEWGILGSGNLDYISLKLNYELCFEVIGTKILKKLIESFDYEIQNSESVKYQQIIKQNKLIKLKNNFCALLAPIL